MIFFKIIFLNISCVVLQRMRFHELFDVLLTFLNDKTDSGT